MANIVFKVPSQITSSIERSPAVRSNWRYRDMKLILSTMGKAWWTVSKYDWTKASATSGAGQSKQLTLLVSKNSTSASSVWYEPIASPAWLLPAMLAAVVAGPHASAVRLAQATEDDFPMCPIARVSSRSVFMLVTSSDPVEPTSMSRSSLPPIWPSSSASDDSRLSRRALSSSSSGLIGAGAFCHVSYECAMGDPRTMDMTPSNAALMSSEDSLVSSRIRRSASVTSSLCRDKETDFLLNLAILLEQVSMPSPIRCPFLLLVLVPFSIAVDTWYVCIQASGTWISSSTSRFCFPAIVACMRSSSFLQGLG